MPRPPQGRVGRSAGVAEHRVAKHRRVIRLSRTTTFSRVSALLCAVALLLAGAPNTADAQTSGSIASTRAEIDATADLWFAAQRQASDLDIQIGTMTKTLTELEQRVEKVRKVAGERAVALYESDTQALSGVMGGDVIGGDPLELGRRAALIGQSNANGQVAIDELEAAIADLNARRGELRSAQSAQAQALRELAARRRTLDDQLGDLQARSAALADVPELAAKVSAADETATTAAPTRSAVELVAEPQASTPAPISSPPPSTGGVSPHHNDPFLVCTRARESSGDYSVISPDGYYGAYQFARTTWNVTATHIGRLDLVGASPNGASEHDQDEMAWALYTWQGNSPWGGRC